MHAVRRGLTSLAHTTAALLTQASTSSGVQLLPTSLQTRLVTSTLQMSTKLARDWKPPENGESRGTAQLTLYNSLVDDKVPFVPIAGAGSKEISWYTCGPTVYDAAHMGHARNYVTFDIVRRILEDYFGYNCLFVMNVTDVDDKIILRARRNYLLAQYRAENTDAATILAYAIAAVEAAANKQTAKVAEAEALLATAKSADKKDTRCQKDLAVAIENEKHKLKQVQEEALAKLKALPQTASVDDVLSVSSDYIAEVLDREKGAAVTDSSIFRAHAARYEREFREDMVALGCREPTITTRVSEYIPQVVTYVEKIIANGMAYAAGGSVYFDTVKFRGCGHTYGKLKPWAVGSALLAAEGESNFETSEKRCPMDFALWKASKPGEPVWDSPWGPGRPGWHIECSAMASAVFGERMDLHSGGEDLRFPHHDNELAQAEAHYHTEGCTQWVNYFLHSGHLEINGLKMSKSLKNFITIKEALQISTARQLRLMFALQQWNKPMIYSDQSMREVETKEAQLRKFFQNVETAIREAGDITDSLTTYEAPEEELFKALKAGKASVHESLSDNINTPGAMAALADLIKATNIYLDKRQDTKSRRPELLHAVSSYVTRILSVMGLVEPPADRPGFGDASTSGAGDVLVPVLDKFAAFRDEIRALCKSKAEPQELLAACDRLRDETMVELGVRLEDKPDGTATWKRDDPAAMRAEQAERTRLAAEAAATKLRAQLAKKEDEAKKLAAQAALPPVEEALAHKYSAWDAATGEPTHDKEGKELDEKAKSKAQKDVKDVRKKREGLNKRLAEDPNYLTKLDQEIETLRQQLQALEVTAANPAQ